MLPVHYKIIVAILIAIIILIPLIPVQPFSEEEIEFVIIKGEGTRDIGYNLEKQGLIYSTALFRIYALSIGRSEQLQAGRYILSPGMSMIQMIEKFAIGDVIKEYITIVEGWNLRDIAWYLETQGKFKAEELFKLVGSPAIDYRNNIDLPSLIEFNNDILIGKPSYIGLEGYLFPDTYAITEGEELKDIIDRILQHFDEKFTPALREKAKNQGKTIFEVITVASLLEKEVQTYEDKQMVAGIIENRLNIGMALQIDASVNYITGKSDPGVLIRDANIDSLFNTYKYRGLPLGPIANPGIESIKATLNPIENPYFYYLSTPDGVTIFSKTLDQHNIAKVKYLK